MSSKKQDKVLAKDSPSRSILKAISWRFIASGATFIISFVIFTQATTTALRDVLGAVSIITAIDIVAKIILYYLHERLWTNILWGKYWRRQAARKRYKKIQKFIRSREKDNVI